MATITPNKGMTEPSLNDTGWNTTLNTNFTILDNSLGGVASINVTGVPATPVAFTSAQYQNLIIDFSGTLSNNVNYQVPSNVGGTWTVRNFTTGAYTLTISYAGGGLSVTIPQTNTRTIISDTVGGSGAYLGVSFADTQSASSSSDTQVVINESGVLTGTPSLTYTYAAGTPTLTANALAITNGATVGGTLSVTGATTVAAIVKSTSGGFTFPDTTNQVTAYGGAIAPAFSGLKIQVTSNTAISISSNSVVVTDGSNYKTLIASSGTIATATSGINGLSTGSMAASTWYYVYAAWNPTGPTVGYFIDVSSSSPTKPSGFTYVARIGVVRTDASIHLLSTLQYGNRIQYINAVQMASGSATVWTAVALSSFIPPTAFQIQVYANGQQSGGTGYFAVAPNNSYTYTSAPIFMLGQYATGQTGFAGSIPAIMTVESSAIYWAANGLVAPGLYCLAFYDNL